MKITVDINGIPTEIELTPEQVVEMQETITRMEQEDVSEIKQWEPQGGIWYVDSSGDVWHQNNFQSNQFGTRHQTKEQAEWASKQMRKFNRLLCYIAEHTDGILDDIHIETKPFQTTIDFMCTESVSKILHDKIQSCEVVL